MQPQEGHCAGSAGAGSAALLAALSLAACAATSTGRETPRYTAPTGGPTARLVMRATLLPGDAYAMYVLEEAERCTGARALGTGSGDRHPSASMLAAGRTQTLEFFMTTSTRRFCAIRLSFEPRDGRSYLFVGAGTPGGCTGRLMDMTDPDDLQQVPAVLHRNPGSEFCLPLAQARPIDASGGDAAQTAGDAVLRRGATSDDLKGLIAP